MIQKKSPFENEVVIFSLLFIAIPKLVGGWTNPFEKYARQKWLHLPQFSGWKYKTFETTT